MNYSKTIMIPHDIAKGRESLCQVTGEDAYYLFGFNEDETVTETIKFPNGYEMDIKAVIPDWESQVWTEAVLFDKKGNQISFTEPSDTFMGEWNLEDHEGNSYTVILEELPEPHWTEDNTLF